MNSQYNRIVISAGIFIGVLLIMCLAAKVMMNNDNPVGDQAYQATLDKLAGTDQNRAQTDADSDNTAQAVSETDGSEGVSDRGNEGSEGDIAQSDGTGDDVASQSSETGDGAASQADESKDAQNPTQSGKHVVVIDAAHQLKADTSTEPIGPGASDTKYKVTSGASGVETGVPEYKLNLAIALLLDEELKSRGYETVMIRTVDEVTISDAERAQKANSSGEVVIHIHGNADDREGIDGTMAYAPSKDNPYVSKTIIEECEAFSRALLSGLNAETGANTWNVIYTDNLTALNWTTIPASHVEVGFLSNKAEDKLLQTEEYRKQIAVGLADGVDLYFGASDGN